MPCLKDKRTLSFLLKKVGFSLQTPLHLAVANNKMEAVKLLVKKANLDLKNGEGLTPLGIAVSSENNQLIEMITTEMGL